MAKGLNIPKFSNPIKNAAAIVSRIQSKIDGVAADMQRGHTLHKQGYGGYRESALSIAKKGKAGGKRA